MDDATEAAQARARLDELRRLAFAQIARPRPRRRARDVLLEIETLEKTLPAEAAAEFHEATALAILARGKRPRRAQKSLYRLFRARLAAGEIEKFERFEQALRQAVPDAAALEGLHFHTAFGTMDQQAIWNDIENVLARLAAIGGEVFLNSGTLLGAVRDKSLIAHDDDVDLALRIDADSMAAAAVAWRETRARLGAAGLLSPRQPGNPGTIKLASGGSYNIDLFPAWVAEGRVHVYPHTCGDLSVADVFPLETCATTGLPIPRHPEAMLAVNYGKGWTRPDPGYRFNWSHANARFAAFKAALADTGSPG